MHLPDPKNLRNRARRERERARRFMVGSVMFSFMFLFTGIIFLSNVDKIGNPVDIQCTVTSEGGPVEGAEVVIEIDNWQYSGYTDKDGKVFLEDIDPGNTVITVRADGMKNLTYHTTTRNLLNHDDRSYDILLGMEKGIGETNHGSFNADNLPDLCGIFIFIFTISTTFQILGIIGLKRDKLKEAKAMCFAGIFSFGFGLSTLLSALAFIHLHRSTIENGIAKKIEESSPR